MADFVPLTEIRAAPHVKRNVSVEKIMFHVVLALLPIMAFSFWQYGLSIIALAVVVTGTCLATERFFNWMGNRPNTLSDWSAAITGLLLTLALPPSFPLWMGAVAAFAAIALGKALFGGIGYNLFNPALVGRAFVQAAFPVSISTWVPAYFPERFSGFIPTSLTPPLMTPPDLKAWVDQHVVDGFTGATPLAQWKFENKVAEVGDLLSGMATASVGETSSLLIMLCGLYLAYRRFLDWRIPVSILGTAMAVAYGFHLADPSRFPPGTFVMFSGGLMLGAWFMATDMVTSPVTNLGVWIYGALIGGVTVLIRYFGGLTEGVMYAILLGNALTPLIDQLTQPRVFGHKIKDREGHKP
jgi:Na+-translocating ferredoxin:NAD+ oxidoreductase subunit D